MPSLSVIFPALVVKIILIVSLLASVFSFNGGRASYNRFRSMPLQSQLLVPQHLDLSQQIFCNVELNGDNLEAVGFDMDFTLAQVESKDFYHL